MGKAVRVPSGEDSLRVKHRLPLLTDSGAAMTHTRAVMDGFVSRTSSCELFCRSDAAVCAKDICLLVVAASTTVAPTVAIEVVGVVGVK